MNILNVDNKNSSNDEIMGLDDEEKNPEYGFLVGWNNINNEEVKYKVNLESLLNLSDYAKLAIESDKSHNKIFPVLGGEGTNQTLENKLASHTIVKKICDWIDHYNSSLNPPIVEKPIRNNTLNSVIKTTLTKQQQPNETIEEECEWYDDFFNITHPEVFQLIGAANYMAMTIHGDIGGLMEAGCVYIAITIKGKSPEEIKIVLET